MAARVRPALVAAAGASVAVAGVLVRRRKTRSASTSATRVASPLEATGRAHRSALLAATASKATGTWAVDRARRVFADAERREELDAALQLRTAEQVAETLGNLKGALMKLGQMASYLDQGMPEPVREVLAELQQNAPPMAPELAASVVEDELGAPPTELFAEWDPVPIAAASIGQV